VVIAQVYVGAAIEPLVDFLCSELAAAFRAEGATLPPWRAADAMLSKWRPRRSVDCDMLPPHGSFRVRIIPLQCSMNTWCMLAYAVVGIAGARRELCLCLLPQRFCAAAIQPNCVLGQASF
jgi:hypothetical protein